MKKVATVLVLAVLATLGVFTVQGVAKEKMKKEASSGTCPKGQSRWHGTITRSDKDGKTITVRRKGGQVERIIHYTDDTKWTAGTSSIEMGQVKDGDDVITCSEVKEKDKFYATRVDKRPGT